MKIIQTAIAKSNPNSRLLNREEEFKHDVKTFMDEYKAGRRNTYASVAERINSRELLQGAIPQTNGAIYPLSFLQFRPHGFAGAVDRRLSAPIDQVSLNICIQISPNVPWIQDQIVFFGGLPATGDFTTDLYFTLAGVSSDFSGTGFVPLLNVYAGALTWNNANNTFLFIPFYKTLNLSDTISLRTNNDLGQPDFTTNPDKITAAELEQYFNKGQEFGLVTVGGNVAGLTTGNTAMVNNAFLVNLSYSFNFYGVVASRI